MTATQTAIDQVQEATRNWYPDCLKFALKWVRTKPFFTSEDLIESFNASHNFRPAEARVWGAVIRQLRRDRLIVHHGFETYRNPSGHSKPVNVWKTVRL